MRGCITEKEFNGFIDGSLDPESLKRIEDHAMHCDACRKEFEGWASLKDNLDAASQIQVPDTLKGGVMSRIAVEKIRPATAGGSVRRYLALAFVSLILLYYVTRPFLGSLTDRLLMDVIRAISANLYAFLDLIGVDPSVPIRLIGDFIANFNAYLPVFASSTLLMIVGFIYAMIRGKTANSRA